MQVRRIKTYEDFERLAPEWDQLTDGVPFRSFPWLDSWWRNLGQGRLYTLEVRDGDALVGIAPWYVEETTAWGRTVRFLGDGRACSDYLGILAAPPRRDEVVAALASWLTNAVNSPTDHWDLIYGEASPVGEPTLGRLSRILEDQGAMVHRHAGPGCWRIELPANWEAYLARLSKSHRKKLRRLERQWLDTRRAEYRTASADDWDEAYRSLVELHQRRRQSLGDSGCFSTPGFERFLGEAASCLRQKGCCQLKVLKLDGQAAAVELQLLGPDTVYAYQAGMDPAQLEWEPGRVLSIAALRQSIDAGFRYFDLCRGDEEYKSHWRAVRRAAEDVRIVPDCRRSQLRHRVWLAGRTTKNWLKARLGTLADHS